MEYSSNIVIENLEWDWPMNLGYTPFPPCFFFSAGLCRREDSYPLGDLCSWFPPFVSWSPIKSRCLTRFCWLYTSLLLTWTLPSITNIGENHHGSHTWWYMGGCRNSETTKSDVSFWARGKQRMGYPCFRQRNSPFLSLGLQFPCPHQLHAVYPHVFSLQMQ